MFDTSKVWERKGGEGTISRRVFNLIYMVSTLAGFGVTFLFAMMSYKLVFGPWQILGLALGVIFLAFLGISVYETSKNPIVSFLGYSLISGPYGFLLGPTLANYTTGSIFRALGYTVLTVAVFGIAGFIYPKSLQHWSRFILIGLFVILGGYIILPLLGLLGVPVGGVWTVYEMAIIAFFCGVVAYDVNQAQRVAPTVDNAIDCSAALYVDALNIFIRYVFLQGRK
jgi:FtsH-binding integral membrane protein